MKWKKGRQDGGYEVLTLFSKKLPFLLKGMDCHLLKYVEGSFIPPHIDKNENGNHHRINVVLKSCKGGDFVCDKAFRIFNRIFYFRPDKFQHSVTKCFGTRYVLSIGWVI